MGGSEVSRTEEKIDVGFVKLFENNDVFVWISQKIQEPLKVKLNIPSQQAPRSLVKCSKLFRLIVVVVG